MKRVSDQTSDLASAIGAIFILVFLNMEIATHKCNDKIYINLVMNCNSYLKILIQLYLFIGKTFTKNTITIYIKDPANNDTIVAIFPKFIPFK